MVGSNTCSAFAQKLFLQSSTPESSRTPIASNFSHNAVYLTSSSALNSSQLSVPKEAA